MKRITWLIICLLIPIMISAQTQQGIVKTRGRMVNRQLMPGIGLPGATVTVKGGNAVVSGSTGTFSLAISGNNFYLQNVQKKGYQLVDADVLTKPYKHSTNPLYLVMETPEQQQSDLLAAERKIRKNLRNQLDAKEAEIEALQASQQEKDSLLRILYQQQTDNEKLIADMAKRYSTLDYDQLDEFYRQVSYFIENGELTRADSLLRTRGDINVHVRNIIKQGQVIQEEKEQIQKAEEVHHADIEEAARRCYSYYETFLAQHQNDSAAYYLELRASIDTTNAKWQQEVGVFLLEYVSDYNGAEKYFRRSLSIHKSIGENAELDMAEDLTDIAQVYYYRDMKKEAIDFCEKGLAIRKQILGEKHPLTAESYNNLGLLTDDSLIYKAILIMKELSEEESTALAQYYENLAGVHFIRNGYYRQAMTEYLLPALDIREKKYGKDHIETAKTHKKIGYLYYRQSKHPGARSKWWEDGAHALNSYLKALPIYENTYGPKHRFVAELHYDMGCNYLHLADCNKLHNSYEEAIGYYELAKEEFVTANSIYQYYADKYGISQDWINLINDLLDQTKKEEMECERERKASIEPDSNRRDKPSSTGKGEDVFLENRNECLAECYRDLGYNLYDCGSYEKAITFYEKYREIYKDKESNNYARLLFRIGCSYYFLEDSLRSQSYFEQAIAISKRLDDVFYLESLLSDLGELYDNNGDYEHAIKYLNEAVEITPSGNLIMDKTPICEQLGDAYAHNGMFEHAIECWISVLENRKREYEESVDSTSTQVKIWEEEDDEHNELNRLIDCYNILGSLYEKKGDLNDAFTIYNKGVTLLKELYGPDYYKIANIYDNIGLMYSSFKEFEHAKEYLEKAFKIKNESDFPNESAREYAIINSYINYGKFYAIQNDSTLALDYYRKAYQILGEPIMGNEKRTIVAECWECVGKVYEAYMDFNKALVCYDEAYAIRSRNGIHNRDVIALERRIKDLEKEISHQEDSTSNSN